MYSGEVVFAQLMEFVPRHQFNRCVRRYRGDYRVRGFSCRDQFLAMAFARQASRRVDKTMGLRSDQKIILKGPKTSKEYPTALRRITYVDADSQRRFVFLTNNLTLPALTIARLYKCRWQVELFFKWIKQHLRIKAFYGTSANAVKTQVWIAICVYVLVAIVKKELKLDRSLYELLQILSVSLFEKTLVFEALISPNYTNNDPLRPNQLTFFDL